jgi:hypothetical protein
MLTELYIEALLADEDLADAVWVLWDEGLISGQIALYAWWLVAMCQSGGERLSGK